MNRASEVALEEAQAVLRARCAVLRHSVRSGSCKRVIKRVGREVLVAEHAYNEARRRHLEESARALAEASASRLRAGAAAAQPGFLHRICVQLAADCEALQRWHAQTPVAFLDQIWS